MSLIPCVECGRSVSSRALCCPQCGCPAAVTTLSAPSTSNVSVRLKPGYQKRDSRHAPVSFGESREAVWLCLGWGEMMTLVWRFMICALIIAPVAYISVVSGGAVLVVLMMKASEWLGR